MLAIVIGMVAFGASLLATQDGVGLYPDEVTYISVARQLLAGEGFTVPYPAGQLTLFSQYPPLFPSTLAALALTSLDPVDVARWLNGSLFGINVVVVTLLLQSWIRNSIWLPLIVGFWLAASTDLLSIHSFALSEPLFILFALLFLKAASDYAARSGRGLPIAMSLFAGGAFFDRYVGASLVIVGLWTTLRLSKQSVAQRLVHSAFFLVVAGAASGVWIMRSLATGGALGGTALGFHPIGEEDVAAALQTGLSWLWPFRVSAPVLIVFGLFAMGFLILAIRLVRSDSMVRIPGSLLIVAILSYVITVVITMSVFSLQTPLDARVLAPVHIFATMLVAIVGSRVRIRLATRIALSSAFALLLTLSAWQAFRWVARANERGLGYRSEAWGDSAILDRVESLPPNATIYTNGPDVLYIRTGRITFRLPESHSPHTGAENPLLKRELKDMADRLRKGEGYVAYFDLITWRGYLISSMELARRMPLKPVLDGSDGSLLKWSGRKQ